MASHIVGGEFELIYISGNTYRLNMILYFDKINGNPGARDGSVTATIFRKRDNVQMGNVLLPLISESDVSYTQPTCSRGEIETSKIIYSSTIVLAADIYNDQQGYYVSWQRCCRNYSISNVFSVVGSQSQYAGQTFYLEFPPVVKGGQPFVNSSPRLFPPLNDYACPFRPYYVDFAGVDDDKDSLVYSLAPPLNTKSAAALPAASPRPYPDVLWRPGYSINNVINGLPDLRITKEGLLTCTPRTQGLFVFAVKVDEFRKGIKIGESRRDFQMLVVDACPVAAPPEITGKKLADAAFTFKKNMNVSFANTVATADRCIQLRVSDLDSTKPDQNFTENISIRVVGLNFKSPNLNQILPAITTAVLRNGGTVDFRVCFPQCPYIKGPYQIGIIAFDDACSLPLTDTLRVNVNIEPPTNERAYFTTQKQTVAQIIEGDQLPPWVFEAKDKELDDLTVSILTDGFALADYGMAVNFTQQKGLVNGQLTWDPRCNIFDFTKRSVFTIRILVDDRDLCNLNDPDTAIYRLNIKLPGNASPTIDTDLTPAMRERKVIVERKVFESLNFGVTGKDLTDNDFLVLDMKGIGFTPADFGAALAQVSGNSLVASNFSWNISCAKLDLNKKSSYTFQFVVVDNANKCRFYKADTVEVEVKLAPPPNTKPQLSISNSQQPNLANLTIQYTLGQPIELILLGVDSDVAPTKDNLSLSLISKTENQVMNGYVFENKTGQSPVQSVFTWKPDCTIFTNQIYENTDTLEFRLADDKCLNVKADTVRVILKVKDVDSSGNEFLLPNVFTPNGDNHNDYFALEGIDNDVSGIDYDEKISLPKDNCADRFESIKIFNRWGDLVFQSTNRTFRWYAPNESAGVYYYRVKYANREFQSPLSIRY